MAIILKDTFEGGGIRPGHEFGTILGQGLQQLAQAKMTQLQQRNQAKAFKAAGYTPEEAALLAQFQGSPETQRKILQSLGPGQQQFLEQPIAQQQQPAMTQTGIENLSQMFQPQEENQFQNPMISQALAQLGLAHGQPGQPGYVPPFSQDQISRMLKPQQQQQVMQQGQPQTMQQQPQRQLTTRERLAAGVETPQMKQAERHFQQKQVTDSYKLHKAELAQYRTNAARAKTDRNIYAQLSKLNDAGKLIQGKERQILEKVGLENFFTNPGSELAGKLVQQLTQGAASAFNTKRLAVFEVLSYERSLPRLINTQQGMRAILKNKDLEAQALEVKQDAARSLVKEYTVRGEPLPFDIEDQIEERAEPQLKVLADKAQTNIDEALAGPSERRSFDTMPNDLSEFEGKTIRDTKTGATFKIKNGKRVKV